MMTTNILIAGGCLTEQHNIEHSRLYHQILLKRLMENESINLNINIIRYERLGKCLEKIKYAVEIQKPELIIFHVRAEPVFRITKIYYRYKNEAGELKKSLNLSVLNRVYPEMHKYIFDRQVNSDFHYKKENILRHYLIEMNYLLGMFLGNLNYGLKIYLQLINELIIFCKVAKIKLIITGPISRPHSYLENFISGRIWEYFKSSGISNESTFINLLGEHSEDGINLLGEEGIYTTNEGHKRIADLIYPYINKYLTTEPEVVDKVV